jgi:hypothetical protein
MKRIGLHFLAACIAVCCFSAQAEHVTKIVGLVNLADWKAVWLEMTDSPSNKVSAMTSRQFVQEGQSFDDRQTYGAHIHVEILQIDFTNGIVKAKEDGKDAVYEFKQGDKSEVIPDQTTVRLGNIGMNGILDFYAQFAERTLLIHPIIVYQTSFPVLLQAHDKAEAATALEKLLRDNGIALVLDGKKFEMVVPSALEGTIRSDLQNAPPPKPDTETPRYSFDFTNVDLRQILKVFETLIGKKMMPSDTPIPNASFTFQTFTPLTKAEFLHAFDTLFAWHGIKAVNIDEKTFKIVQVENH